MDRLSDGRIDVSEDILELSEGRREIAFERACRVAGINIAELEDNADAMESPIFVKEFSSQLVQMLVADDMAALRGEGQVWIDGVNQAGYLRHYATAA